MVLDVTSSHAYAKITGLPKISFLDQFYHFYILINYISNNAIVLFL